MFAAIYKVLPDRDIPWREVRHGAATATVLFAIGKYLISLYIGSSAMVTSDGAAASVIVMLPWRYDSAQIFLLGGELAKVLARHRGIDTDLHSSEPGRVAPGKITEAAPPGP